MRSINNSPTNTWSLTTTCLDSETNTPVSGVELSIVGQNIHRTSGATGFNTFLNLGAGNHKLIATHPNYITLNLDFTVVAGETNELAVMLVHN